jgi:cytochrome c peroxidase
MLKPKILFLIAIIVFLFSFEYKKNTTPYRINTHKLFPKFPIDSTNLLTIEGVELGRYLFYDSILSKDYNMSCASCHKQQFAFSDSPNKFSKGYKGKLLPRNTLPLFNLVWYKFYFWDGRAKSLQQQAYFPVSSHDEMNLNWIEVAKRINKSKFYKNLFKRIFNRNKVDSSDIVNALVQFESSLISSNSKFDKVLRFEAKLTQDEIDGFELMNNMTKGDCLHCHTTDADPMGTTFKFSNNGLDKIQIPEQYADKGKGGISQKTNEYGWFKIPSVRNLGFTAPYMHDGRFNTLEEVLDFYSDGVQFSYNIDSKMEYAHQGGVKLNKDEKRKIITFLKTLNDSSFVIDSRFSNPFQK